MPETVQRERLPGSLANRSGYSYKAPTGESELVKFIATLQLVESAACRENLF